MLLSVHTFFLGGLLRLKAGEAGLDESSDPSMNV
jgi:hypothetical protein